MARTKKVLFKKREYRQDILDRIRFLFMMMVHHHQKVFFLRIDVRFPKDYAHDGYNKEISALLDYLKRHYKREKNHFVCLWVRERKKSEVPHYHLVILLNGHLTQDGRDVRDEARKEWAKIVRVHRRGCVRLIRSFGGKTGIMIRRPSGRRPQGATFEQCIADFRKSVRDALQWARYLAKTETKGEAPPEIREFHGTRLPRDMDPMNLPPYFPRSIPPYTPPEDWGEVG